jgi:hypothetical protein
MLSIGGCIGDRVSIAKKVDGIPNTFTADVRALGENILAVKVYRYAARESHLAWQIRAIRSVPARGFQITAGTVPDGFEQMHPSPSAQFAPAVGAEYGIIIETDATAIHTGPTLWVGEAGWQ